MKGIKGLDFYYSRSTAACTVLASIALKHRTSFHEDDTNGGTNLMAALFAAF